MAIVADLHVHTTNSDGTLDPDDVPRVAIDAGLDAVAITDHDRLPPELDAPVVERESVTVINGIELRAVVENGTPGERAESSSGVDGQRVDLLGYAVEPTAALVAEVDRLQRDRLERAATMIGLVEERLGVTLDVEPRPGVGRPHVARAIERSATPCDYDGAFEHLIGDGGPCFVPREVPSFDRARDLLVEASAIVALAHPLRYEDPEAALARCADLDAVERWYPYGRDVDHRPVDRAIANYGLLPTGGSDAHDERLGRAGLDEEAFEQVRSRLP